MANYANPVCIQINFITVYILGFYRFNYRSDIFEILRERLICKIIGLVKFRHTFANTIHREIKCYNGKSRPRKFFTRIRESSPILESLKTMNKKDHRECTARRYRRAVKIEI